MTETKSKQQTHVRPSSRDPITNWLDVFTKLLAVPPAERMRIRDELEDHLRMRVEDLLILGMSEPEAVQKAVTELGETAELAKRFKEARTNTRRRIVMHTALFAVAGLALTMSVANFIPGSNTPSPASSPAEVAAVQPEQGEQGEQKNGYLGYDIEGGMLEDVLMNIGEAADSRVFVHWGSLEMSGIDRETEVGKIPSKGLELDKVRELLNSMLGLEGGDSITARMENGLLEFGTVSYFDKREIVTMDHDVSGLVPAGNVLDHSLEASVLSSNIMSIIEPDIWNSGIPAMSRNGSPIPGQQVQFRPSAVGAIAINGTRLSVRAPERVQVQIIDYIARLRVSQQEQDKLADRNYEEMVARNQESRKQMMAQMHQRIEMLQQEIADLEQMQSRYEFEFYHAKLDMQRLQDSYNVATGDEERHELGGRLVGAQVEHARLESKRDQTYREINALVNRLSDLKSSLADLQFAEINSRDTEAAIEEINRLRRTAGNRHPAVVGADRTSNRR